MNRDIAFRHNCLGMALIAAFVAISIGLSQASRAFAGGVVTDCTSAVDLTNQLSGGGLVTFDCGANPPVILLPAVYTIAQDTTIDGGGVITLSGGNSTRHFIVDPGVTLTLQGINITKGYSANDDGGAISNRGTLNIENSTFTDNHTSADWSGGAIVSYGPLTITGSEFAHNSGGNGGAIYPRWSAAVTTIANSSLHHNLATNILYGWGGAMLLWDGAGATISSSQIYSNTSINRGGGISTFGPSGLVISDTQFINNRAIDNYSTGGGIYSDGVLVISRSSFSQNESGENGGGGLYVGSDSDAWVSQTVFNDNQSIKGAGVSVDGGYLFLTDVIFHQNGNSSTYGGAMASYGDASSSLIRVTMSNNRAVRGGAIYSLLFDGNATLTNVTISGNSSDTGGGIYQIGGTYTITNVTVFGNSGLTGAGGLAISSGVMTVNNTIVANNIGGDCALSIASNSFSLSSDNTCGFPLGRYDVDVALAPLAPNGGFTQTHLPLPGSPVIDNGTGIGCPSTDQRGVARPQGAACDVGAVEYRTGETVAWVYLPMITR